MKTRANIFIFLAIALTVFVGKAQAVELITNGGFETGNFSAWTATNASSAWKLWAVSPSGAGGNEGGTFVPVPNATSVQQGTFNAWNGVTAGAGSPFTLVQEITIPAGFYVRMTWMDRYQMNHNTVLLNCVRNSDLCGRNSEYLKRALTNTIYRINPDKYQQQHRLGKSSRRSDIVWRSNHQDQIQSG